MKTLAKLTLAAATLTFSLSAVASDYNTDGQRYSACKIQVIQQFDDIKRIKIKDMKTRRGVFHSMLKLSSSKGGKPLLVSCTIDEGDKIAVSCLNDACSSQIVAEQ